MLLLGASGAGKSTLLLALAGLLDPSGGGQAEGELRVRGRSPSASRQATGIVFQDPETQLVMARTGDDVAFGLENRAVAPNDIWPRVDAALDAVAFPYPRDHPTNALSGGEKQRLALAGVLALRPALLLLDEPTANLDPEGAETFRAALRAVLERTGATLVLVEHRVADSLDLIDRVVVLSPDGRLARDGPPDRVFAAGAPDLAAAGIWVPGEASRRPRRGDRPHGTELVVAERLDHRYPPASGPASGGHGRDALAEVELTVPSAHALALLGPNGSGKTTLSLILAGLLRPTAGRVRAGRGLRPASSGPDPDAAGTADEIWRWPASELVQRIGSVFQDPEHQFLTHRVDDELALGPRLTGVPEATLRRRVAELLERLHLEALAAANPFTLSGGEKRRLSVATALATAPVLLVLDEPTFGQDRRTWRTLLDLLAELRDQGHGIVLATHDLDFASALADDRVYLGRGRVVSCRVAV